MAEVQVVDKAGQSLRLMKVRGQYFPRFPIDSLNSAFDFKARPDDVLLCTYPKSGTHWMFEIIQFLQAGSTDLPILEQDDTMIEENSASCLESFPSPRLVNTHYHFEKLSPDIFRKKCKTVYMTRNPRDVAVSFFHHHRKLPKLYEYDGDWKDYLHLQLEGKVDYESWFEHLKGWEKGMKEHPDHPFLVLSYEAMKQNPQREIKRVADFLDIKCSEDLLKEIAEKTDFDAMRKKRLEAANGNSPVMYRKGKVGDWKNLFTVAQSELFNQAFETEMVGTDAYKLYSHTVLDQADANMNSV